MNSFPGIELLNNNGNPTLTSPNSPFQISLYQTRESLMDVETYRNFLNSIITRFRKGIFYTPYKSHLMKYGLDRSLLSGNLTNDMCEIEMHHYPLTIFDDALIITEHILNTRGYVTSYEVIKILKQEHRNNRIPVTFITVTEHQLYHNTDDIHIGLNMVVGKWWEFLSYYSSGVTLDIALKLLSIIDKDIQFRGSNDNKMLEIRQKILNWSGLNDNTTFRSF